MKTVFEHAAEEKRLEARSMTRVAVIIAFFGVVSLVGGWWKSSIAIFVVSLLFGLRVLGCFRSIKRYAMLSSMARPGVDRYLMKKAASIGDGNSVMVRTEHGGADDKRAVERVVSTIEADPAAFREPFQRMLHDGAKRFPDWADYIKTASVHALDVETTGEDGGMTVAFSGDAVWFFNARYDRSGFKEFHVKTD